MKDYLILLMLGISTLGFQGSLLASQGSGTPSALEIIHGKLSKRQPLSPKEEATLKVVKGKVQKSAGDMTVLSPLEQNVYNLDRLNNTSPTLTEILEKGKQFPWGLDLILLEERGLKLRDSVGGGGADVSSVVYTYQKISGEINTMEKEKKSLIEKMKDLTEKMNKAQRDKLSLSAEQTVLKEWQDKIVKLNAEMGRRKPTRETAVKSIMQSTGLERSKLDQLPDLEAWKDMKAHPEKLSQIIKRPLPNPHSAKILR